MDRKFDRILVSSSEWTVNNTGKALALIGLLTILAVFGLSRLTLDMTFYSLMPRRSEKVADLRVITETYPAASAIIAVVESDDPQQLRRGVDAVVEALEGDAFSDIVAMVRSGIDVESEDGHTALAQIALLQSAGEMVPADSADQSLLAPGLFISAINGVLTETLQKHAMTPHEQNNGREVLSDLQNLMRIYLDEGAISSTSAFSSLMRSLLAPDPYFINDDENMALVYILPSFTVHDIMNLTGNVNRIERAVKQSAAESGVTAGITGLPVVGRDEAVTSEEGLAVSSLFALALIIFLLIVNFRMKSVPLLAGIPLLIGMVWTAGAAGILLGRLNIMTAMYLVALLGLGVDFAIHYLTAFMHERETGKPFLASISEGVGKSGRSIAVGALTTAAAFFALLVADSELVFELAVVAGTGVLCELLAMLLVLPVLLSQRDRWISKYNRRDSIIHQRSSFSLGMAIGSLIGKVPLLFFSGAVLLVGVLLAFAPGVEVETNIMEMEAEGLESIDLQERMVEGFAMAPDALYILSGSLEESRELNRRLEALESVSAVDAVTDLLPAAESQQHSINLMNRMVQLVEEAAAGEMVYAPAVLADLQLEIGMLLDNLKIFARRTGYPGTRELERLVNRCLLDTRVLMRCFAVLEGDLLQYIRRSLPQQPLALDDLDSSLWAPYMETVEGGTPAAENLVTIYAADNLWEEANREALYGELLEVTGKATGIVMAADQITSIARRDGVRATLIALLVISAILLIDFRNIKLTLITILPLLAAIGSLFGFMALFDIKFDFINIIAIPLLVGIGIDDAIHISHRYRDEGRGSMGLVVKTIGRAILMTSLTTMVAFASFIPSIMRAMRSTGIVLTVAMLLALLFSIFLHGALLVIARERMGLNLQPWKRNKSI